VLTNCLDYDVRFSVVMLSWCLGNSLANIGNWQSVLGRSPVERQGTLALITGSDYAGKIIELGMTLRVMPSLRRDEARL